MIANWISRNGKVSEECDGSYVSRSYPNIEFEQELISFIHSCLSDRKQSEILDYMGLHARGAL